MKTEVPLAVNRGNLSSRTGDSVQRAWLFVSMQTEQNRTITPCRLIIAIIMHSVSVRSQIWCIPCCNWCWQDMNNMSLDWLEKVWSLCPCAHCPWLGMLGFRVGNKARFYFNSFTRCAAPPCMFERVWGMLVPSHACFLSDCYPPKRLSGCTGHDATMDNAAAVTSHELQITVWLMPRHVIVLWQISSLYFSLSLPHIILLNDQRGNHTVTFTVFFQQLVIHISQFTIPNSSHSQPNRSRRGLNCGWPFQCFDTQNAFND